MDHKRNKKAIEKKNRLFKMYIKCVSSIKIFYIKNIKHIETACQLY